MRLVIATGNAAKAGEMKTILGELLPGWELLTLNDFVRYDEPEESGETYAENASIKAVAAAGHTGEVCIADDAGLEVDAMDGAPGVRSKRFAGEGSPFAVKIGLILENLAAHPELPRSARFQCAVAVAGPGMPVRVFQSAKEGVIATGPRGERGFGYDPIFFLPELGMTYAELEPGHKNRISHRGIVLAEAAAWLLHHGASLSSG